MREESSGFAVECRAEPRHGCWQCERAERRAARAARRAREAEEEKDAHWEMIVFFGVLLLAIVLAASGLLLIPGYDGERFVDNPSGWTIGWIMYGGGGLFLVGLGSGMLFRRRAAKRRKLESRGFGV